MSVVLHHADCFDVFPSIKDQSIDLILCDPPYGTTACNWDSVLPLNEMWKHLKRIVKPNSAVALFGSEPFSSNLRLSNLKSFKHDWVWYKNIPKGHLNSKKYPMRIYELIHIFCYGTPFYYPQMSLAKPMNSVYKSGGNGKDSVYKEMSTVTFKDKNKSTRYPVDVLNFPELPNNAKLKVHPTQKPVSLLEYLIKTYSLEGQTVLDFTMGSGSTGVACKNANRNFIGIEKELEYYEIAKQRILSEGVAEEEVESLFN